MAERFFAIIGILLTVYLTCFETSRIVSGSMTPTLKGDGRKDSDVVLTERISYWFRDPRRWELVAFETRDHLQVMKRTVGLPGENIQLERDGTLRVDGDPIVQPGAIAGLKYLCFGNLTEGATARCGDGFFMLGDDSADSVDSRFDGPLDRERIRGRPWLIVWPPSRIQFVNP
jgi:signal peptidase I